MRLSKMVKKLNLKMTRKLIARSRLSCVKRVLSKVTIQGLSRKKTLLRIIWLKSIGPDSKKI